MNAMPTARVEITRGDRFHTFSGVSFGGVTCSQYWADFYLWEVLLNERPKANAIVELGTWEGGFSLYLAAQADVRGLFFRTYDVIAPERRIPGFVQLDIFAEAEAIGQFLTRYEPLLLLCDGGNKPRELQTFSRSLSPESLIVTHDWGTEIFVDDVPDNVHPIFEDFCEEIGSCSRVFQVND